MECWTTCCNKAWHFCMTFQYVLLSLHAIGRLHIISWHHLKIPSPSILSLNMKHNCSSDARGGISIRNFIQTWVGGHGEYLYDDVPRFSLHHNHANGTLVWYMYSLKDYMSHNKERVSGNWQDQLINVLIKKMAVEMQSFSSHCMKTSNQLKIEGPELSCNVLCVQILIHVQKHVHAFLV